MRSKIVLYYNDLVFRPSDSFLFKDFGQVPYVLAELSGADLEYWVSTRHLNREFWEFRGRRVRQFGKALPWLPARLDLMRNGALYQAIDRERDLTHFVLFPFTPLTDFMVVRKLLRRSPHAKILLKLDTNREYLESIAADWRRHRRSPVRFLRQSYYYRELLQMAHVVLCETSECEGILRSRFLDLDLEPRLVKTFSGISQSWLASIDVTEVPAEARRSSIIVSGRISSWQKNTPLIFEAGGPPPGWMIEFIGEVDATLQKAIDAHRANDPEFDRRYRFHGAIDDKRTYFNVLAGAKALLMNSRGGEGFPNVFAEAHLFRLFIMTSDVSGSADATGGGRWGLVYPRDDANALRAALLSLPTHIDAERDNPAREAYRRRFIWEHSLDQPAIRRLFYEARGAGDPTG